MLELTYVFYTSTLMLKACQAWNVNGFSYLHFNQQKSVSLNIFDRKNSLVIITYFYMYYIWSRDTHAN